MADDENCLCKPDEDGVYEDAWFVCDRHRMQMRENEYQMKHGLDDELEHRIRMMFGERTFERSTAPVAKFAVSKRSRR